MNNSIKAFLLIATILVFDAHADQQTDLNAVNFLCNESHSFAKRELEFAKNIQSSMEPKLIYWNSVNNEIGTEVIVFVHPSTCGNMGCSAFLASNVSGECIVKPISAVQPHIPVRFIEGGAVEIDNIGDCVRWHINQKSYIRAKCN